MPQEAFNNIYPPHILTMISVRAAIWKILLSSHSLLLTVPCSLPRSLSISTHKEGMPETMRREAGKRTCFIACSSAHQHLLDLTNLPLHLPAKVF